MEWWCDLWLKEGFANFVGTLCVATLFPEWNMWADFVAKYDEMAMAMDANASTHSIEVEVNHPDDLNEIYDSITYEKSASVIRHTRALIGAESFRAGLARYLEENSYKNTKAADLFASWASASGKDVEALIRPYTSQPGFPLVTVSEGTASSAGELVLDVHQDRFFSSGLVEEDTSTWPVPLLPRAVAIDSSCSACADGSCWTCDQEIVFDNKASVTFTRGAGHTVSDAQRPLLVKLNADQQCFYRIRYSPSLTQRLADALRERAPQLTAADRVGLVSDAFALSHSCLQPAHVTYELARGLANEKNFSVWSSLVSGLTRQGSLWDGEVTFVQFCRMIRSIVQPRVKELGWKPAAGESDRTALLRRLVLGCAVFAEDETVIAEARKLFAEFAKDPHNDEQAEKIGVASDCVDLLYQCEVLAGGAAGYQAVQKIFETTTVDVTKQDTLTALTRTPDRETARALLDWAMTDAIKPQHKHMAFQIGRSNRHCRDIPLDWVLELDNFKQVHAALDASGLVAYVVRLAAASQRSEDAIDRLDTFFKVNSSYHRKLQRTIAQASESIRNNVRWIQHNRSSSADLASWLQEQYPRAQSVLHLIGEQA
jgi:puromycin-sensitive aminopeptidase